MPIAPNSTPSTKVFSAVKDFSGWHIRCQGLIMKEGLNETQARAISVELNKVMENWCA